MIWSCTDIPSGPAMSMMDLVTWISARDGVGRTGLLAGFMLWVAGWLAPALGQVALGAIPTYVTVVGAVGGLVGALLALLAGAFIYKEP